jgi:hypothetical protein
VVQVAFVADKNKLNLAACILFDFLEPFSNVVKCDSSGDVVNKNPSNRASVVGPGDRFEGLLTSLERIQN